MTGLIYIYIYEKLFSSNLKKKLLQLGTYLIMENIFVFVMIWYYFKKNYR